MYFSKLDRIKLINSATGLPLALSIFADRPHVRSEMRDQAEVAGFRITESADVASLLDYETKPLGEVVLIDCPQGDVAELAALTRLDVRAANCGAHLIVSSSLDALEEIIICLDRSSPQILVNPSRAERVIALSHALLFVPILRVCELSKEDKFTFLSLAKEVGKISERLGGTSPIAAHAADDSAFRFETPRPSFAGQGGDPSSGLVRAASPPLPDPRLVRRIARQRQLRARFFDGDLFADPAWDMLLDLTAARVEHTRVSVTSLCIASGVPPTTALRWIGQMTEAGLFQRVEDESDRRRAFVTLTDKTADAMARYFADLGGAASQLV